MTTDAVTWTDEEMEKYNRLVGKGNRLDKIGQRLSLAAFTARHGKEKCDAMFAAIQAKG